MSPRFRPPGRTFKERWPQEVEETRYYAATTYAVVLGGILGVLTVPLGIWQAFSAIPLAFAVTLGLLIVLTVAIGRVGGHARRWVTLAWKIGAWVLAAAALGLIIESMGTALCGDLCRTTYTDTRRPTGVLLVYGLLVVGSVSLAMLADRWGNALRRRGVIGHAARPR